MAHYLDLRKDQEKQLRKAIQTFIAEHNECDYVQTYQSQHIYGYQLRYQNHGTRIFFKKLNLYSGKYFYEPNITVAQAKEYFSIK